jgi:hypothetical protein
VLGALENDHLERIAAPLGDAQRLARRTHAGCVGAHDHQSPHGLTL